MNPQIYISNRVHIGEKISANKIAIYILIQYVKHILNPCSIIAYSLNAVCIFIIVKRVINCDMFVEILR